MFSGVPRWQSEMAEMDRTSSPPEDQAVSARGHGDDLKDDSREGGGDMEESREGDAEVNERSAALSLLRWM